MPVIESEADAIFSDQDGVISYLDSVRIKNFNEILDRLNGLGLKANSKILDIGCATGLFLKVVKKSTPYIGFGVEPNPLMANLAQNQGLEVVNGYFPDALENKDLKFDTIIFNDVLEHIPNVNEILRDCRRALRDDGFLVINLPNSKGLFFEIAKSQAKLGFVGNWKRLWQYMFYTPHVHYFNGKSLDLLLNKEGFSNVSGPIELNVYTLDNLWRRIAIDKSNHFLLNLIYFIGLIILFPITKIFHKDIFFSVYKKSP